MSWQAGNGTAQTNEIMLACFILPELNTEHVVEHTFHLLIALSRKNSAILFLVPRK